MSILPYVAEDRKGVPTLYVDGEPYLIVNALLVCHDLALSCCHEIAMISVMECSL